MASNKTANQLYNERFAKRAAEAANLRAKELKAKPWWTCRSCGEQFRWDQLHHCDPGVVRPQG